LSEPAPRGSQAAIRVSPAPSRPRASVARQAAHQPKSPVGCLCSCWEAIMGRRDAVSLTAAGHVDRADPAWAPLLCRGHTLPRRRSPLRDPSPGKSRCRRRVTAVGPVQPGRARRAAYGWTAFTRAERGPPRHRARLDSDEGRAVYAGPDARGSSSGYDSAEDTRPIPGSPGRIRLSALPETPSFAAAARAGVGVGCGARVGAATVPSPAQHTVDRARGPVGEGLLLSLTIRSRRCSVIFLFF